MSLYVSEPKKNFPSPMEEGDEEELQQQQQQGREEVPQNERVAEEVASAEKPTTSSGDDPTDGCHGRTDDDKEAESTTTFVRSVVDFYFKYQFPLNICLAIAFARAYPPLGAEYLAPHITATWLAVAIIFLISGLGLRTQELSQAFGRFYFNATIQIFNFFVVSGFVFCVSRLLVAANMLNSALADGMVICACLPMAINIVIVLTATVGGDEAASVFNSTVGNLIGIFLSPALILLYLGSSGDISLPQVFMKLTIRVVVPLVVGQVIQKTLKPVQVFFKTHKRKFKKAQEYCLAFVVYTVFCRTFESDSGVGIGNVFLMILYQFLLMLALMTTGWYSLKFLFPNEPELRAMGFLGCFMKTVALGIPLISSIYEGNPNEALYTLPILIWHPMQLVIGSMLVPRLTTFVAQEQERLLEEKGTAAGDEEQPRTGGVQQQGIGQTAHDTEEDGGEEEELDEENPKESAT